MFQSVGQGIQPTFPAGQLQWDGVHDLVEVVVVGGGGGEGGGVDVGCGVVDGGLVGERDVGTGLVSWTKVPIRGSPKSVGCGGTIVWSISTIECQIVTSEVIGFSFVVVLVMVVVVAVQSVTISLALLAQAPCRVVVSCLTGAFRGDNNFEPNAFVGVGRFFAAELPAGPEV